MMRYMWIKGSLKNPWDESTLVGFDPSLDATGIHCPILVAQEGFSCDPTLMSQIESLLLDA
jgi:hypothetical protein